MSPPINPAMTSQKKAGMVFRLNALWRLLDAKRLERLPQPG